MPTPSIPTVTVERFYLNHAEKLQLKLIAGGAEDQFDPDGVV